MINHNVGAWRPANDETRAARLAAANDLVQRTLARHGLMPNAPGGQSASADHAEPMITAMLSRLHAGIGDRAPKTIPVPAGAAFQSAQFTCAAGSRAYLTYVPATATKGATGIVVMLHGCTQTPEDFATGTGMNALADQHGFVVIYPQQSRGDNAQSCWNWFSPGDQRRDRGEPAIIAGLTRKAMAEHGVSNDCTFVAGLSAGAAMAVILGETYPDIFAGVGAHSGLPFAAARCVPSAFAAMAGNPQELTGSEPDTTALRTIIFHGTADVTVHPSNGDRIARRAIDRGPRQTIETDEQGSTSGRSYRRKIVASAGKDAGLEHWIVEGLGHAWSGGQPAGSFTDAKGPDASAEMIRFFFGAADGEI